MWLSEYRLFPGVVIFSFPGELNKLGMTSAVASYNGIACLQSTDKH
jgi:hypothetical protein